MILFLIGANNLCTFILSLHEIRCTVSEKENIDWNFLNQRYPYNVTGHSTALFVEVLQV